MVQDVYHNPLGTPISTSYAKVAECETE